jgi:D-alanine transaminase
MSVYLNGSYVPRESATVSVLDRGFVFGDGIYEVWRVVRGGLFEHERHVRRLVEGAEALRLTRPAELSRRALETMAARLLADAGLQAGEATFYVQVTRGVAPRTHHFPPEGTPPTVFAMVNPFSPPEALRVSGATAVTVPDVRWHRCNVKTIQLLPNAMAKQQAQERGALEAVLVRDGVVTEGSHTNVMAVVGGTIRTHPANELILAGVTRAVVLELAAELGIAVEERPVTLDELWGVDELFLTGTTTDVMPLVRVDDRVIGGGTSGPVSRALIAALHARMDATPVSKIE